MKRGLYPGSFDDWHPGHEDILNKSLNLFDYVTVLLCLNAGKVGSSREDYVEALRAQGERMLVLNEYLTPKYGVDRVYVAHWAKSLKEYLDEKAWRQQPFSGIIRGLRNGHDLQYEMNNQYWAEDIGITTEFVYFMTARDKSHYSSSAIKTIKSLGLDLPFADQVIGTKK